MDKELQKTLVRKLKRLSEARMILWELAMEAESIEDTNTLYDAIGLVVDEAIKIELSEEWDWYEGEEQ